MFKFACLIFILIGTQQVLCESVIEDISDDDLVELFKSEDFVVVLFSKKNCDECDLLEQHLLNIQYELQTELHAHVVKAFASQLVRLYSPTKEPALVFFRHGVPLLYSGPANDELILQRFSENKSPVVKELSDETFEHLTQASSGATTGDWFIMFYTQECVDCQRLNAVWEAVGAELKQRMNAARMNLATTGALTAQRFNVKSAPEFLFFRQGKYYRYEVTKFDVKSFVLFAQDWYKNARAVKVPVPTTPFDGLVLQGVKLLQKLVDIGISFHGQYPYVIPFIVLGFALTLITAIFAKYKASKKTEKKVTKKAK